MNLRSLEYFLEIYHSGSLGKASIELGISQPALSKNLRQLESQLGVSLFKRTPLGVEPTLYAQMLEQHSRAIGGHHEAIYRDIRALSGAMVGSVRLGMNSGSALKLVPRALMLLAEERPQISTEVVEGIYEYLAEGVTSAHLDFALVSDPTGKIADHLVAEHFLSDPFVVAMSANHKLGARRDICPPEELLRYPWVFPPGSVGPKIVSAFRSMGQEAPSPKVQTSSMSCIRELILGGQFLAFVPRSFKTANASNEDIVFVSRPELTLDRTLLLLKRKGDRLSPSATACVAALKASVEALTA